MIRNPKSPRRGERSGVMPKVRGLGLAGAALLLAGAGPWYSPVPNPAVQSYSFVFPGKPSTGQVVNTAVLFPITVPANLSGTVVYDGTLTTSNAVFTLNKVTTGNTITAIGTVTITSTNHFSATLSTQAAVTLAAGDALQMVAPTQDATLADVSLTVYATKN